MARSLTVNKKKVLSAVITVNDNASYATGTNQGTMEIYSTAVDTERDRYTRLLTLGFQRNILNDRNQQNWYNDIERLKKDVAPVEFDFGHVPFGVFYAGYLDMGRDIRADSEGIRVMSIASKLIEKVQEAISEYNIRATTNDEMKQWADALRKFGVKVETRYYISGQHFDYISDMDENLRHTAAKYVAEQAKIAG